MSDDRIIEIRSEEERRHHQRRREDQVRVMEQAADMLARERRYQLLQAATTLMSGLMPSVLRRKALQRFAEDLEPLGPQHLILCLDTAEEVLTEIERREKERIERERKPDAGSTDKEK